MKQKHYDILLTTLCAFGLVLAGGLVAKERAIESERTETADLVAGCVASHGSYCWQYAAEQCLADSASVYCDDMVIDLLTKLEGKRDAK